MIQIVLWIGIILLAIVTALELWHPNIINEGFEQLISIGDSAFWAKFVPRRGDIGLSHEENGYIRDDRYFNGYADIQRLGVKQDYCRMVSKKDDPTDVFFACALGGTEGLSSMAFRTQSANQGFEMCRDDYMHFLEDGRDAYCRIVKVDEYTFQTRCNEAEDIAFRKKMTIDSSPPPDIELLLRAYQGIIMWLRFRDDMVDYAKNLITYRAGNLQIEEFPPLPKTAGARTLEFNGIDQYLRIGENKDLEFGNKIELRYMRAVCFWVYFEEFTNNAHIFDFGNGANKDNVFCGIIGRGNSPVSAEPIRDLICDAQESTVPKPPSGAQPDEEVSAKELMMTTPANVNDFNCPGFQEFGRIMPQTQPKSNPPGIAKSADIIYEIWDHQQRKMHVQVTNMIPLKKWVHITITSRNSDAFRPQIDFYRNGELMYTEADGWLPQENFTSNNYIGKSNWSDVTSPYQNADELFKGRLFDFRTYRTQMSHSKIKETYDWGKKFLEIP